ncbi:MAG: choice-of-anchor J domain-containing protein [Thermoplasmatales archaeon]|nr:choice-of-anchor J domain-containing protein [Thermoplasmatales archaeon]
MKGKIVLSIGVVLAMLVSSIAPIASSFELGETITKEPREVRMKFDFLMPKLNNVMLSGKTYSVVDMGLPTIGNAGEPEIPVKPVNVLLPYGAELKEIKVIADEPILIGKAKITPKPSLIPIGENDFVLVAEENEEIYNSDEIYPGYLYKEVTTQYFRGFPVVTINLYPVQWNPLTEELYLYPNMELVVELKDGQVNELFRGTEVDRQEVTKMVDNPREVLTYPLLPSHSCEYVIITNEALKNAPGPYNFQALANSKIAKGMNATIVTVEWIYSNFGGVDNPEKIRNFIRWAYQEWHTQYVLLGGDADAGNEIVPVRRLWNETYFGNYKAHIPSDLYYACLDGSYNSDGDSYWGEPTDGEGGKDVDLIAEVYVGRAPVDNAAELANFVRKTLEYDSSQDPYLNKVLLCSEYVGFGGIANYGSVFKEEMRNGSNANGYYTVGIPGDEYTILALHDNETFTWSVEQLKEIINSGIHIINHLGHGTISTLMKMVSSDIASLENEGKYFFLYTQACLSGNFTYNDSIAEKLVKSENGAFAVITNADYGFGRRWTTDAPSQAYDREFFDAVYGENIREIGKANQDSKEDNLYRLQEDGMRWCYYGLNLLGDPEIAIKAGAVYNHDVGVKSINEPKGKISTGTHAINATIENSGLSNEVRVDVFCSIYKLDKVIHFFDDMESGSANWTVIDKDGDGHTWTISTARYKSPTHSFRCTDYTTYLPNSIDELVSKAIDLSSVDNAILEFWYWAKNDWLTYAHMPYGDYLTVYLSSDDGVTWVEAKTYITYTSENWWLMSIPIEKYVNLTSHVRIKFTFVSDALTHYEGTYIDDVVVYSWVPTIMYEDDTRILIDPGEREFVEFAYNFSFEGFYAINVTAFIPDDEYPRNNWKNITIEVRNIKDAGVISINSPDTNIPPGSYTVNATVTNLGTIDLTNLPVNCTVYYINQSTILDEDFEFLTPPNFRTGWLVEDTNGDGTKWVTSTSYPYDGFNCAFYQSHASNTASDWVFTPALNLKGGASYTLSFWYRAYSASYPASMRVMIGSSQSSSGMTTLLWNNSSIKTTTYTQATISFSVESTGTYYIGFHSYGGSNANRRVHVDKILLNEVAYEIIYSNEINIASLPVRKSVNVEFSSVGFSREGDYIINVTTKLADDEDTTNDLKSKTLKVISIQDAGIKQINYPTELITTGNANVNLTLKNYGNVPLNNVGVNCLVYSVGTTLVKEGFNSRSSSTASPGWTFSGVGRGTSTAAPSPPYYLLATPTGVKYVINNSVPFGSGNYAMELWIAKDQAAISERVEFVNISYGNSSTGPWNTLFSINYTLLNAMEVEKWYRVVVDLSPCANGNRWINISATLTKTRIRIDDVWIYSTNLVSYGTTTVNLDVDEEKYVEIAPCNFGEGIYDIIATVSADADISNNFLFFKARAHNLSDLGVLSINSPPAIIPTGWQAGNVTVKNFGNIQKTNIPVNLSIYIPETTIINETFEGLTPPNFSPGWAIEDGGDVGGGSGNSVYLKWASYNNSLYAHSSPTMAYFYFGTSPNKDANDWLFTNATYLEAGKAYWLKFWYRVSQPYMPAKLDVWVGSSQSSSGMTKKIWDNSYINNTVHNEESIIFTVPADGAYYIGFHVYSYVQRAAAIYVDDIQLISLIPVYSEEKTITSLAPDEETYLNFGPIYAYPEGEFILNVKTTLEDENVTNDGKHMVVKVWNIDDAGTKSINYPPSGLLLLPPDQSIRVNATITNYGNVPQPNIPVNCSISKLTYSPILEEDFESGLPSGWIIENGGATAYYPGTNIPATWTDQNPGHRVPEGGCRGRFMIVDNDYAGWIIMEEGLVTKDISCAGQSKVILEFDHAWLGGLATERGLVQVCWYDSHEMEWVNTTIATFTGHDIDIGHKTYDITSLAAGKTIRIKWYYNSYRDYGFWWMVDNVRIGGEPAYDLKFWDEKTVNDLDPGEEAFVEFEPWNWFSSGAGWYAINVTTMLDGDEFPSNDTKTTIVFLQGAYDVEVRAIESPLPGIYTTGTSFAVNATVKNVGAENLTDINVICTIRNSAGDIVFTEEKIVSTLASGQQTIVGFSSWTANIEDTYTINVTASIYGDANLDNNYKEISIVVNNIPDAAVVSINYPTGTQFTGSYAVNATVANFGNVPIGSFNVNCTIRNSAGDIVFTDEETVSGLAVGQKAYVIFAPWTVSIEDTYKINVTTMLVGDEDNSNDYQEITIIINDIDDVGMTSINYPPPIVPVGEHIINATVKNFGNIPKENIPVNCSVYLVSSPVTILQEGFEANLEPPAGWNEVDVVYTGGDWSTSGATTACSPYYGYYMARFNSGSSAAPGSATRLYPDRIDFTSYSNVILAFWMYHDTNNPAKKDRIVIQYSLDNTTWNNITSIYRYDGSSGWKLHTIDLSPYVAGKNAWVAFMGVAQQGGHIYIDEVSIISGTLIPVFSEEKIVSYLDADEESYLTFTPIDASVEGITFLLSVKTKLAGDENTGNDEILMLGKVWNFEDVGVVSINYPAQLIGPGLHSVNATVANYGNVPVANIKVNCSITQIYGDIKIMEGFETSWPPAGWKSVIVSGSAPWSRSGISHTGSYAAYSPYQAGERYLATDVISLGSGDYTLEFWLYRTLNSITGEYLNISVGPSQNGPWTTVLSLDYNAINNISGYKKFTVNLSSYANQDISIRFNHLTKGGASIWLDDIVVYREGAGLVFENEKEITYMQVGEQKHVLFDAFNFEAGQYLVKVKTILSEDENIYNDAKEKEFLVFTIIDAGVVAINYPTAGVYMPGNYSVVATVKNYGTVTETFDVKCDVYKVRNVTALYEDVEGGWDGWAVYEPSGINLWHISTRRYVSGSHSFYCGDELTGSYYPNIANFLISPGINVAGAVKVTLSLKAWIDVEDRYDYFYITVSPDGTNFYIVQVISTSSREWRSLSYDITNYASSGTIWLGFILQSDSAVQYEGVYLDDIVVTKQLRDKVYTETVTVYNLLSGAEKQVTFPPFTAEENSVYVINVRTLLAGDINPGNDTKEVTISTVNLPPVTTCSCVGSMGENGWYVGPVTIYLSATDPQEVRATYYRINGGAWQTYTGPVSVSTEGLYKVEYYSVDTFGSTEEIKSCSFGIATSMPITECIISGLLGDNGWYKSDVQITLKANAYICGVKATYYRIDGGAWQEYTGTFTYSGEGNHIIEYYSISNAGIVETPKSTSFKIDKTSPTAKVIYPNGGEVLGGIITIRWTASDNIGIAGIDLLYSSDAGLTWNVIASNVANTGSYNWNVASLPYGSNYMVKVVAKDNAGNVAVDTSDGTFTISMPSPPTVSIIKPRNALYIFDREIIPLPIPVIIGGITVEATASSSIGIAKVEFYIDGALKFTDTTEPYSWLWDERAIGTHEIKVIAYDTTGQKAEDRISVFIINF